MMTKEVDAFTATSLTAKAWNSVSFNGTFSSTPCVATDSNSTNKKSGVDNVTTTGCDVTSEVTECAVFARQSGYDAGSSTFPESDAGSYTLTAVKTFESISFGSTFGAAPVVIGSYAGTTAGGKKFSVGNTTTTGCDVSNEETALVYWIALKAGVYN